MRNQHAIVLALALLLACGGGGGDGSEKPTELPEHTWTWVNVPGAVCADGSPTGIAVNRGKASDTLVLFLMGGGACWDPVTCDQDLLGLTDPGPFGAAEFQIAAAAAAGTILDRNVADPIFGDATLVFVPYCTGDVHWGQSTRDYGSAGQWRHAGKANLSADIAWLQARLQAPGRLVVSGSSAGGFGSALAHDLARQAWPSAKGYLVDDSGPPLVGGDIPAEERALWTASWGLDQTLPPLCADCTNDLSQILSTLAAKYPQDRIALLSYRQDRTIRYFFGELVGLMDAAKFEESLLQLVDERITPAANARAFLLPGTSHVLLGSPLPSAGEVTLSGWLTQMVNDDPAWATVGR